MSDHTDEPLSVDNFVVNPGDGHGKWFLFEATDDDGPIAEFYGPNAEADARRVVKLWNAAMFAPRPDAKLREAVKSVIEQLQCTMCYDSVARDAMDEMRNSLAAALAGMEGR